jgi:hypothetical protein
MPTKKGAHGKLRHYNSRNGRYEKENIKIEKTLSSFEKEMLRRENLKNKSKNSKDKLLPNIYSELEKSMPGCIIGVNNIVYDKIHSKTRELDLETKDFIIEIKSGTARRCASQLLEQQEYAKSIGKSSVVYAPNILAATEADYKKKGIVVIKDKTDLIKLIKGGKKK